MNSIKIFKILFFLIILKQNIYSSQYCVPSQYNTIQSAIDASTNGDTVQVNPGVYRESINFHGKSIIVKSVAGHQLTRIDAPALYAVTFESGEDTLSVLLGFSIGPEGANVHSNWNGILCSNSSPTIEGNVIERLKRAVMVVKGSPVIKKNLIQEGIWTENTSGIFIADTCSPVIVNNIIYGYYHGIRISGSSPRIFFNTLDQNKYGIFGAGNCVVANNIISNGSYGIVAVPSSRISLLHNDVWNNGIQTIDMNYQNCPPGEGDISDNPLYQVSPLYSLKNNSPCIDQCVDVGVGEDFLGNQRPAGSGFDMGAFEYGAVNSVAAQIAQNSVSFYLEQNYPNPFNGETIITYYLQKDAELVIQIYNLSGQIVRLLHLGKKVKGIHAVKWDGKDDDGMDLSSGMYVCRLKTDYQYKNIIILLIK